MIRDSDLVRVLQEDGINDVDIHTFVDCDITNLAKIRCFMGKEGNWAVRVTYNKHFGGVVIQQMPGEGNRFHFHPNAAECWVILEGTFIWWIHGAPQHVTAGDIVNVPAGAHHRIRVIGDKPAVRFAVTVPDVVHQFEDDNA
ncbi:hypothetical protein LCGC14_0235480 [marine sediment metagenome]|uniref:Cupin type-2 domain-containing protein n=1 Tax=marine sediment metagenome TaxID=412755 RepID=A0A0F9UQ96_9ZZZZ